MVIQQESKDGKAELLIFTHVLITHVLLNKVFHFLEFSLLTGKITVPHVANFKL